MLFILQDRTTDFHVMKNEKFISILLYPTLQLNFKKMIEFWCSLKDDQNDLKRL